MDTAVALKLHDDLLASQPDGARHDSDICPFCVEKASQAESTASDPSGSGRPDVSSNQSTSTEGGTKTPMSDISQEAHEALLKKAVSDAVAEATATTEKALETKTKEAADAAARVTELETEVAGLKTETDRINKELDAAQVKLTSATEEAAALKKAADEAAEQAQIAEVASKRGEQVKNLKLFPEEYVSEKASKWASLTDEAWGEQLEEWKQLKPASTASGDDAQSDAASAMTGTSEKLTKEQQDAAAAGGNDKPKARRSVLGLS